MCFILTTTPRATITYILRETKSQQDCMTWAKIIENNWWWSWMWKSCLSNSKGLSLTSMLSHFKIIHKNNYEWRACADLDSRNEFTTFTSKTLSFSLGLLLIDNKFNTMEFPESLSSFTYDENLERFAPTCVIRWPHAQEFKRHAQLVRLQMLLSVTLHMLFTQEFSGSVPKYLQSIFLHSQNFTHVAKSGFCALVRPWNHTSMHAYTQVRVFSSFQEAMITFDVQIRIYTNGVFLICAFRRLF